MNTRQARQILRGYRPSGADDEERDVREALKIAQRTPELEADFQNQLAFDGELAGLLNEGLPSGLSEELEEAAKRLERGHPRRLTFRDPAMITVGFSFLVIVGLVIWILMGQMDSVAGMQDVVEMVQSGDKASADQFQSVETSAGALNDWFAMQSFEGFAVPRGMESAPVLGARILKHGDTQVAVAVVANPKSLCYVFNAEDFGISPPKGKWKIVKYGSKDARAFAVTRMDGTVFVIAPREGGAEPLQKYLDSLPAAK